MTDKKTFVFHRIFRILLSISFIAAGLSLIYGCLCIYYSGPQPYSREAVSDAFYSICVPVYLCLGLTAASIVLDLIFPYTAKTKAKTDYKNRLALLTSKKDLSSLSEASLSAISKERKERKLIKALSISLVSVAALVFLVYALNGKNFDSSDINGSIIKAMVLLVPCLAVMLGALSVAEILTNNSIKRETRLISDLPTVKKSSEDITASEPKSDRKLMLVRGVVLLLALGLLIFGFATGGFEDVLTKAVNICTECIGLG